MNRYRRANTNRNDEVKEGLTKTLNVTNQQQLWLAEREREARIVEEKLIAREKQTAQRIIEDAEKDTVTDNVLKELDDLEKKLETIKLLKTLEKPLTKRLKILKEMLAKLESLKDEYLEAQVVVDHIIPEEPAMQLPEAFTEETNRLSDFK